MQGESHGNKYSAARAAAELLNHQSARADWGARVTCTENNCKKHFSKWTKEKKDSQKQRATQQLAGNGARSRIEILGEAVAVTTTTVESDAVDDSIVQALALEDEEEIEGIEAEDDSL